MSATITIDEIRIQNLETLLCVHGIEYLEHIHSQKFIIAVNQSQDIFGGTVLSGSFVDVWQSRYAFFVSYEIDWLGNGIILDERLDQFEGAIPWSIIDDYHFIIAVILIIDWLKIVLISEILSIIESRHNYAERLFRQWEIMLFG